MRKLQEILKKMKENNKGFSLVELIIVIAIMAILIGVVGTQVLPYIEKSREAKDQQVLSSICTAAVTAFSQNATSLTSTVTDYQIDTFSSAAPADGTEAPDVVVTDLQTLSGFDAIADVTGKMESQNGKGITAITIVYNATDGTASVTATGATGSLATPITAK